MAVDFDALADATVRIISGQSSGSGFHFLRPEIIVTADHVVEDDRNAVEAIAEDGTSWSLRCRAHSPPTDYDFAIFEIDGTAPTRKPLLPPDQPEVPSRGTDVALAGFPHGIPHLLVQRGIVAGPNADKGFYIDVPVNAGNSGGPAVDEASGLVLGVVTASRFLQGDELEKMSQAAQQIEQYFAGIAGQGSVGIMGMDFGQFAQQVGQSNRLLAKALELNANTGLGIAVGIEYIVDECRKHGLL